MRSPCPEQPAHGLIAFAGEIHDAGIAEMNALYMGFYIHSCQKSRYKGEYAPSYLADPVRHNNKPLARVAFPTSLRTPLPTRRRRTSGTHSSRASRCSSSTGTRASRTRRARPRRSRREARVRHAHVHTPRPAI